MGNNFCHHQITSLCFLIIKNERLAKLLHVIKLDIRVYLKRF